MIESTEHFGCDVRISGSLAPFEGPLDLLLTLARQQRYPLDRLPLARLTGQFLAALARMRAVDGAQDEALDPDVLAAFIETGAWLVMLKSRTLLPRAAESGMEVDPAQGELGRALVDHAAARASAREAAGVLAGRLAEAGLTAGRAAAARSLFPADPPPAMEAAPPTMQDAVLAARRALAAVQARAREGAPERFPIEAEIAWIEAQLAAAPAGQALSTASWFDARPEPEAQATLLLALLEVVRTGGNLLHQWDPLGPLLLKQLPA